MKLSAERQFGTLFTTFFLGVALLSSSKGNMEIFYSSLSLSFFLAVATILNTNLLRRLSEYWHKFGVFYSKLNNPIVFGILFFFFLSPYAILMRLFNRDELKIVPRETDSYWLKHDKIEYTLESFKNQYWWYGNFMNELFRFLKQKKKMFLIPLIIVFLLFGGLIILASNSVLSPFIYTFF